MLAHVVFALHPIIRWERAISAKQRSFPHCNYWQQAFLDFVLSHYESEGVEELDQHKLIPLLRLKYNNAIVDEVADFGKPEQIREVFVGFQKYLYQQD